MDSQTELVPWIRQSTSPLLQPTPLAHSQQLADSLPQVRRYVGPRAWYQCLEEGFLRQPVEKPAVRW